MPGRHSRWNFVIEMRIKTCAAAFSGLSEVCLKRSFSMMQINEIQQRFDHVEQTIHHASEACRNAIMLPMDLKDSIQQLDEKSEQAKKMMQQTQDQDRIRQCIDDLEEVGDRVKDACERAGTVDEEIKNAVMQAHRELSDLKHQLH
jgi:methyl-accepting chemotaxis protein